LRQRGGDADALVPVPGARYEIVPARGAAAARNRRVVRA
jgi:hypothetical protein